ncbi:MAG TPA: heavy metal-responsive transcriptional regulator [Acidimicrobiales bacterium]
MRIGELAELARVSTKTLRYYEELGLLTPPNRTASGYRDYSGDALDRLGFIRSAQAIGLTLGEIREVIAFRDQGETPCAQVLELIERRRSELDARIRELQHLRRDLDHLARRAQTLDPADCSPETVCHLIVSGRQG